MTIPAIAEIQGRIAGIQGRFGGPGGAGGGALPDPAGAAFAADLAAAGARLGGRAAGSPAGTPGSQGALVAGGAGAGRAGTAVASGASSAAAAVAAASGGARATAGTAVTAARAVPAPAGRGGGVTGADVVAEARRYLGVPYVKGGGDPKRGLDCSGLTEIVYEKLGFPMAPVSWQQVKQGKAVGSLAQAKPGDLVFFDNPTSHVGIYIGGGKMIHAPRPGKDVQVADVYRTPSFIRRILPDAAAGVPASAAPAPAVGGGSSRLGSVPYADLFRAAEKRHGVPATLLSAVAKAESGYRPDAVSHAGARGLMQIMPGTARELGVDPMDPRQAVDGAARLLKSHLKSFGSVELALAAYNAGPGAVRKYDGIPPYAETRGYVRKVMSYYAGSN